MNKSKCISKSLVNKSNFNKKIDFPNIPTSSNYDVSNSIFVTQTNRLEINSPLKINQESETSKSTIITSPPITQEVIPAPVPIVQEIVPISADDIIIANRIESLNDLEITAAFDHSVKIPNCQFNVDTSRKNIIDPPAIKLHKIFIIERTTIIRADSSCDGIEIILYNKTSSEQIIRDIRTIICKIKPRSLSRLLYISFNDRWITE